MDIFDVIDFSRLSPEVRRVSQLLNVSHPGLLSPWAILHIKLTSIYQNGKLLAEEVGEHVCIVVHFLWVISQTNIA
jgi:hypothetical protein